MKNNPQRQRHLCLVNAPLLMARDAIIEAGQRIQANALEESVAAEVFDWGYDVQGNTGILPVRGALAQRPDFLHLYMGGSSVDMLRNHFQALLKNNDVSRIVLSIDSPGGYVSPIAEFSDLIYQARGQKEIVAVVNSMACSAAYWIASAADHVVMNDATATAGSIGVYIAHRDISRAEEKFGIKTTEITAGRYKAIGSPYKPLSDEGKETLQARADYIYSLFVDAVARNRGLDPKMLTTWADGQIFHGQQAVDAGLADSIQSFFTVVGANSMTEPKTSAPPPAPAPEITEAYLAANHPQLLASIRTKAYEDGIKAGVERGRDTERARVTAIDALERSPAFEGFGEVFTKAKTEGWSEAECNAALVKAQVDRGISMQQIRNDSTQAGQFSGTTEGEEPDEAQTQAMLKRAVDSVFSKGGRH